MGSEQSVTAAVSPTLAELIELLTNGATMLYIERARSSGWCVTWHGVEGHASAAGDDL